MLTQKEQDETLQCMKNYHSYMSKIRGQQQRGELTEKTAIEKREKFTENVKDFLKEIG